MSVPETIAIASRNTHKLREVTRICADWPVRWVTVENDSRSWPEVEETGATYLDNARLKARAIAEALDTATLADDSGIEVDALGGDPGPRSARYAGDQASDAQNLDALVRALRGIPAGGRTARYRCVVVLARPGETEIWSEGICEGMLLGASKGKRGFGYDPIFVPEGWDRTMAELSDAEKDRISHRGRALRSLKGRLTQAE